MNVTFRPIEVIANSLRSSLDQIERATSINLRRGRLQRYLELLDRAAAGEAVMQHLVWTAALEIADIEAAATLPPQTLRRVRHRLGELTAGPLAPNGEHDKGRDLAFELALASMLQRVDPNVDLDNPSDVALSIDGHSLLIECKRPSSIAGLRRRVIEGYRQLSEHRRSGHRGLGAIAIDLSLVINPQSGVLPAETESEAISFLYGHIQQFIRTADRDLQRARRHVRNDADVHMFLFRLRSLAHVVNGPMLTAQAWRAEPLVALQSPTFALLHGAMDRLPFFDRTVHVLDARDPRVASLLEPRPPASS